MKVVFLESVEGTALVGEVKDVKNGFARNYLLPRGLAAPATEPYLQRANVRAKREAKKQEGLDRDAGAVAARLEGAHIEIIARVGEQGKLYGSVTAIHIAEEVAKLIGDDEFDHRKVLLPEAIKEIGVQPIRLRLTRNVEAAIELEVIAEGVEEEEGVEGSETEATAEAEAGDATAEEPKAELAEADTEAEPEADTDAAAEPAAEQDEETPAAEAETEAAAEQEDADAKDEE